MDTKKKGFVSIKDWKRKDWGKGFLVGLLAAMLGASDPTSTTIWSALLETISFLGLLSGLVWLYLKIKRKDGFVHTVPNAEVVKTLDNALTGPEAIERTVEFLRKTGQIKD